METTMLTPDDIKHDPSDDYNSLIIRLQLLWLLQHEAGMDRQSAAAVVRSARDDEITSLLSQTGNFWDRVADSGTLAGELLKAARERLAARD